MVGSWVLSEEGDWWEDYEEVFGEEKEWWEEEEGEEEEPEIELE